MIKHLWFDFSETLVHLKEDVHNRLRYAAYAEVTEQTVNPALVDEYEALYQSKGHSNAAVFRSLGCPTNFWSERMNSIDPHELYELADPQIPEVLRALKELLPISIFSNIQVEKILEAFEIPAAWFAYILSAGMVKEPKPALDGYLKMIQLSGVPANNILYIGDDLYKDVRPAKQAGLRAGLIGNTSAEADQSFANFNEILKMVQSEITRQ